jgi:hypothetical protein
LPGWVVHTKVQSIKVEPFGFQFRTLGNFPADTNKEVGNSLLNGLNGVAASTLAAPTG